MMMKNVASYNNLALIKDGFISEGIFNPPLPQFRSIQISDLFFDDIFLQRKYLLRLQNGN